MTKRKALKKSVAFFAVLSIVATMFSFNVFAASNKVVPTSIETFDSQSYSSSFGFYPDWQTSVFTPSYVQKGDDLDDYALQIKVNSKASHEKYYRSKSGTYRNGTFSVEYMPVSNISGNNCVALYFRATGFQTPEYVVRLYDTKVNLACVNAKWGSPSTLTGTETTYIDKGIVISNTLTNTVKVSFETVDSKNHFKVWINDILAIDYTGDTTGVENTNAYINNTGNYIAIGVIGNADDAETSDVDEAAVALFDNFTIYEDVLNRTFSAADEYSTTEVETEYWANMKRQYTDADHGKYINGNLELLSQYGNYSNADPWYAGWEDVKNGAVVSQNYLKPSAKTNGLAAVRVFKAPFNGVVTIGAIDNLKNGTAGKISQVHITLNNEVVWPKATDTEWLLNTGTEDEPIYNYDGFAYVDNAGKAFTPITLNVSKGDNVCFVVYGTSWTGDAWAMKTTWKPTVKYTKILDMGMNASLTDGENVYANVALLKEAGKEVAKNVVVKANVNCDGGVDNTYQVLVATYNSDGVLLNAKVEDAATISDTETDPVSVPLGTTGDISSVASIKVFLFDSTNTILPLSRAISIR